VTDVTHVPDLHLLTDGRFRVQCGKGLRLSVSLHAGDAAEAWGDLLRLGWSLYASEVWRPARTELHREPEEHRRQRQGRSREAQEEVGGPAVQAPKKPIERTYRMADCGTLHDAEGKAIHTIRYARCPREMPPRSARTSAATWSPSDAAPRFCPSRGEQPLALHTLQHGGSAGSSELAQERAGHREGSGRRPRRTRRRA
jgi:hypothetical protein